MDRFAELRTNASNDSSEAYKCRNLKKRHPETDATELLITTKEKEKL